MRLKKTSVAEKDAKIIQQQVVKYYKTIFYMMITFIGWTG